MLPEVLSLTSDKEAPVWKGLILVFFLFIARSLQTMLVVAALALGQVSGLYKKALG